MLVASIVDSASVPLPIDIMVAGWSWADQKHFYVYALLASVGSAIGGLVPFFLGRAGGEIFLLRYVNRERFEEMRIRFEKQEFLGVMVPSLLPPPATWKIFIFAAGVFEMRIVPFMLAVFTGRLIRFGIETILTVEYGPQIVSALGDFAKRHATLAMLLLAVVFAALGWWIWRKLKGPARPAPPQA